MSPSASKRSTQVCNQFVLQQAPQQAKAGAADPSTALTEDEAARDDESGSSSLCESLMAKLKDACRVSSS
ncbi:hypothetical protein CgunFtcFv8_009507 [Champsocephalus gunnari]|uniref:Uncharacterized protein n=1 Tax=Champsocephalus gunnari TaxID=52237 RepID=A0AAN8C2Y5_CHAGU|nr:hypothetical protein CgunFtcFv8_009507 [Champsocephalus gunnari]